MQRIQKQMTHGIKKKKRYGPSLVEQEKTLTKKAPPIIEKEFKEYLLPKRRK